MVHEERIVNTPPTRMENRINSEFYTNLERVRPIVNA